MPLPSSSFISFTSFPFISLSSSHLLSPAVAGWEKQRIEDKEKKGKGCQASFHLAFQNLRKKKEIVDERECEGSLHPIVSSFRYLSNPLSFPIIFKC